MKLRYKHVIFDLDRTLWDFETNARLALHEIYHELSLDQKGIADFEDFESTYKTINEKCWNDYRNGLLSKEILRDLRFKLTLDHFGVSENGLATQIGDAYLYKSPRIPNVIDGTHEILNYLKPLYDLHILTNGFIEVQGLKMEKSKLKPYFKHVVASELTGEKKPHRQAFLYTLNQINGKAEECIMIGDDPLTDVKGASDVGMDTVFFNPEMNPDSPHATFTISHLSELKSIL